MHQDYLLDESGTYPAVPEYALRNEADLVEVRYTPTPAGTAVRLTMNALADFDDVGATLALGDSPLPRAMPHGAGARMPAEVFVTVHGGTGDVVDAATGQVLQSGLRVSVDERRRQVDVVVPYAAFDPRGRTVRAGAAVGLWDRTAGAYRPKPLGAAFYNVAFRYTEAGLQANEVQSAALLTGELSAFSASIDFTKLAAGTDDDMPDQRGGVPQTGTISAIYPSTQEARQGRGPSTGLGTDDQATCVRPCALLVDFPMRLQPYTINVPASAPAGGYGLVTALHGCGLNYRPLPGLGVRADELAESLGAVVISPGGRGGCHWYWSLAGLDVFEAMGDARRRFKTDDSRVYVLGGSMGGYGSYRLSAGYPDLFGAIAPYIACNAAETEWAGPGTPPKSGEAATLHRLARSWRHLPVLAPIGIADDTCTTSSNRALRDVIDGLGYRYDFREYPGEHAGGGIEPAALEQQQFVDWFKDRRVVRNPARISYAYNVRADEEQLGLNADHAYWLSGITARQSAGPAPLGTVEAFSRAFGEGEPVVGETEQTAGRGYVGQRQQWLSTPKQAASDVLDLTLTNVSALTVDAARAKLSCGAKVNVISDGPVKITLAGCLGKRTAGSAAAAPPAGAAAVPVVGPARNRSLPATGGSSAAALTATVLTATGAALVLLRRRRAAAG